MSIDAIIANPDLCQAHVEWLHHCYALKSNGNADCFLELIVKVEKGHTSSIVIFLPHEIKNATNRTNSLLHPYNKFYYTRGFEIISQKKESAELVIDGYRTSIRNVILKSDTTPIGTKLTLNFTDSILSKTSVFVRIAYEINNLCIKSSSFSKNCKYSLSLKYYHSQDAILLGLDNALDIYELFTYVVLPSQTENISNVVPNQFQQRTYNTFNIRHSIPFYGLKTARIWKKLPRTILMWALERNEKPVLKKWSSQFFYCDYEIQLSEAKITDINDKNRINKLDIFNKENNEVYYQIWTRAGKKKVSEEELLNYKENCALFVDARNFLVFINGDLIQKFNKNKQAYNILITLMENGGSATIEKILNKNPVRGKKRLKDKEKLRTPISRLRGILEDYGLNLPTLETRRNVNDEKNYYYLDESINFILAQKLERD